MSSDHVIRVSNVSKRYEMYEKPRDRLRQFLSLGRRDYFKEFWALRNVSFEVGKGETVGILGRNGSGKSTLLQIIAGTLAPTSGIVETRGVLAALLELGSGFTADFTGRENVYLNGSILGLSREEMDAKFEAIASFADIGEHLDQPVKTYSSGMYVRLAFAVQACIEPQILIVDEALSVGDEKFQRKCFDHIEKLRSDGCSVLVVTHSTATVEKFCQRGVLLHNGEVHGIGCAKEIVDQYHALLYSDEKAYLRYLNSQAAEAPQVKQLEVAELANQAATVNDTTRTTQTDSDAHSLRAIIKRWQVEDGKGNPSETFLTGEPVRISFDVDVLQSITEIQAGVLLRTVEGVSAYGTSTLYHDRNFHDAHPGATLRFSFDVQLDLCPGIYFVTLAIAEAISPSDMLYLDRKTDVIVIKVSQPRIKGSGIAALNANVSVSQVNASIAQ